MAAEYGNQITGTKLPEPKRRTVLSVMMFSSSSSTRRIYFWTTWQMKRRNFNRVFSTTRTWRVMDPCWQAPNPFFIVTRTIVIMLHVSNIYAKRSKRRLGPEIIYTRDITKLFQDFERHFTKISFIDKTKSKALIQEEIKYSTRTSIWIISE